MRRKGTQCGWLEGLPFLPPHPTGNSLFRQDRGILGDRSRFLYPLTRPFLWCENKRAKQGFIMLIKLTDSTQWRLAPPKIKITKTKQNQNQGKMFHVCNVMQFVFFQVFSFLPRCACVCQCVCPRHCPDISSVLPELKSTSLFPVPAQFTNGVVLSDSQNNCKWLDNG